MSDIRLFRVAGEEAKELKRRPAPLERALQNLIEEHLETLLGIRFLATEYSTGPIHGGRIDTLGIDENNCPVIIEYKRALNENVISQVLFYSKWLLDHRAEFQLLVQREFGMEAAEAIDWSSPRLLCIAGDFTRYDEDAVQQINGNIELIRYREYGGDLLLLELINAPPGNVTGRTIEPTVPPAHQNALHDLHAALRTFILALGSDVQEVTLQSYVAFKRLRNFACVKLRPHDGTIIVLVKIDPTSIALEEGFTRDMRDRGRFGTGDLEIRIRSDEDLERAKPLIQKSWEDN
jgi:predicted transport protein